MKTEVAADKLEHGNWEEAGQTGTRSENRTTQAETVHGHRRALGIFTVVSYRGDKDKILYNKKRNLKTKDVVIGKNSEEFKRRF